LTGKLGILQALPWITNRNFGGIEIGQKPTFLKFLKNHKLPVFYE